MPIQVLMPALSPTMEEGKLTRWLVKEGDAVKSGTILAEIETDKATMEVEAVDEGTVAKIVVPAGTEGVKVNALIAVLAGEGEDVKAAASGAGSAAPAAKAEAAPKKAAAKPATEKKAAPAKAEAAPVEAKAEAPAKEAPAKKAAAPKAAAPKAAAAEKKPAAPKKAAAPKKDKGA